MESLASTRASRSSRSRGASGGGKAFAMAAVALDKPADDAPVSKEEIAEAFNFYDKKHAGSISLQKLRPLMMSLGIALTEEEFATVHRNVRGEHGNKLNLRQFVHVLHTDKTIARGGRARQEILTGMKYWNRMLYGDGTIKTIPRDDFTMAMKKYGEPMNAKEMAGIMDAVRRHQTDDEARKRQININTLVSKVLLL